jgi:hypothetical protein
MNPEVVAITIQHEPLFTSIHGRLGLKLVAERARMMGGGEPNYKFLDKVVRALVSGQWRDGEPDEQ